MFRWIREYLRAARAQPGTLAMLMEMNVSETKTFEAELADLLNRHSMENASNTPDYLLAEYLKGSLDLWNKTVSQREEWYGRGPQPVEPSPFAPGAIIPINPGETTEEALRRFEDKASARFKQWAAETQGGPMPDTPASMGGMKLPRTAVVPVRVPVPVGVPRLTTKDEPVRFKLSDGSVIEVPANYTIAAQGNETLEQALRRWGEATGAPRTAVGSTEPITAAKLRNV